MFTIKGQSIPASVTNLLMGGPDLKMVLQGLRNYSLAPGLLAIQINSWADLYMYLRWTSEQSQGSNKPLAISSTSAFISLATAPHLKLPPSHANFREHAPAARPVGGRPFLLPFCPTMWIDRPRWTWCVKHIARVRFESGPGGIKWKQGAQARKVCPAEPSSLFAPDTYLL